MELLKTEVTFHIRLETQFLDQASRWLARCLDIVIDTAEVISSSFSECSVDGR